MDISANQIEAIVRQVVASMGTGSAPKAAGNLPKVAKVAMLVGPKKIEIQEVPLPELGEDDILIKVEGAGICGTDVHFHRGTLAIQGPTIIGHEFVGKLTDCDPAEAEQYGLAIGDNVIADIAVPCGECLLCKTGDDANCVNMGVTNGGSIEEAPYLWGGYTEVNYTPLSNLVKIPEGLDPTAVAVFACPGPTAMHAFRLGVQAGLDWAQIRVAVVQGAGPVGSYAAMYMKAMGVPTVYVIAKNVSPEREALLKKLAQIAVERQCGRLEWWCLDWNQPSIDFYLSLGAEPMSDWTTYRIAGDTLKEMAK